MIDKILRKGTKFLIDKHYRFRVLANKGLYNYLSDEEYLRRRFVASVGRELNLSDPKTFNEKLQWLKLYDRKDVYTQMVDKYAVKLYVEERIGKQYIIPTLGVWEKFEDIDFALLPNRFVLKCTHDSGGLVICTNKATFNIDNARKKINKSLKRNYYYLGREWAYKNVKPRIIAEKYMEDECTSELRDYKFFCFNGVAKLLFIASERQNKETETKFDFFDMDFNHLDIENGHPNSENVIDKPSKFNEMRCLAEELSKGIPHVRVDFYEVNGQVYFGELTFSHWSGFVPFEPEEWDETLGAWIELPEKEN